MTEILAIDPGVSTGWARIVDGQLVACGLGDPPVTRSCPKVIIERPQVYRGRASKGDPNDLITLAIQVGRYTERFGGAEHVLPHTWKGSVDADVLCRRVLASLTPEEQAVFDRCTASVAKSKLHNVIDAVGIGKWSVKRTRAAVFC